MADRTDIVSVTHAIEQDRAALVADLEELRLTLRRRLDPREHIRAHPRAALIFAFTAGVLLRVLFFRQRSR
jgi:hypothetical protein